VGPAAAARMTLGRCRHDTHGQQRSRGEHAEKFD
jgi:hypothetical protein